MLEEEKPELLDDWDPRLVVTTLTFDEETKSLLVFDQVCGVCQDFLSFCKRCFSFHLIDFDVNLMPTIMDKHHMDFPKA